MSQKTLPTARLTMVLLEAMQALKAHQDLRNGIAKILKGWPSPEYAPEIRDALRDLQDLGQIPMPTAVPEAVAYLRTHGARIARARNNARLEQGLSPVRPFLPRELLGSGSGQEHLAVQETLEANLIGELPSESPLSLEDIEAKLKDLKLDLEEN